MADQHIRMKINGMTCTGCEKHVEEALASIGAKHVKADFHRGEALLEVKEGIQLQNLSKAVQDAGYQPVATEVLSSTVSSAHSFDYDLLIIGSGGAAFAAAIKATEQHGARVAMVEKGTVGGTCVNVGCVPSKTLLRAGEINHLASHNPFRGLSTQSGVVDLKELITQKNDLVADMRQKKYEDLIGEYGFELIRGAAHFLDEQTIEVNGRKITAQSFLIATGASPSIPEIQGLHEVEYLTSTTALELEAVPKRLAVIGAGYIALELGQLFQNLGSHVTIMQRGERLLKDYDPEISVAIHSVLQEQEITVLTGVTYERIEETDGVKKIHVSVGGQQQIIEADQLLIATGRRPNTDKLNLQAAGVEVGPRSEVVVGEDLRTSNPRIFAAGDVTLGPQFVYVAAYEGGIVADNAVGGTSRKVDLSVVPGVTFTTPAVATVGLTEEQAQQAGYTVKTSVLPLDAVPRALVNRETSGVFKIVADAQTQRVLGIHVVADNAGDVIYAATLAVKFKLTIDDLRDTLAPYLTMAEGIKLAALTFDKDVSKLSCCAG